MDETRSPGIAFSGVFLRESRFSHRSDPLLPLPPESSGTQGNVQLNIEVIESGDRVVAVNVRVTSEESESRYDFSVQIMGIFELLAGEENMSLAFYARHHAPALLYPFVREALGNLTARGRFGPIWLNPANIAQITGLGAGFSEPKPVGK